jgi:hypothetical protein
MTKDELQSLGEVEKELKSADEQFEEEEGKDAATEAVFASRKQSMSDLDKNADGVLSADEVRNFRSNMLPEEKNCFVN